MQMKLSVIVSYGKIKYECYTCDSDSSIPVYGLVLGSSIPVGDQTFPDLKNKTKG